MQNRDQAYPAAMNLTSNHALHRTLHQRRCACWCRAGEGRRSAAVTCVNVHEWLPYDRYVIY
jgi:hypothetical protein